MYTIFKFLKSCIKFVLFRDVAIEFVTLETRLKYNWWEIDTLGKSFLEQPILRSKSTLNQYICSLVFLTQKNETLLE